MKRIGAVRNGFWLSGGKPPPLLTETGWTQMAGLAEQETKVAARERQLPERSGYRNGGFVARQNGR